MPLLRQLTINVRFLRHKKLVFQATTWAGYIGILTGLRQNGVAVAVNFRPSPPDSTLNLAPAFSMPIGLLVRVVMEQDLSYEDTLSMLAQEPIMAPCYLILASRNSGHILTRCEDVEERRLTLQPRAENPATRLRNRTPRRGRNVASDGGDILDILVQTNMDHWDNNAANDKMESLPRRRAVNRWFKKNHNCINLLSIWGLLKSRPIGDYDTIYSTVMVVAENTLESHIHRK